MHTKWWTLLVVCAATFMLLLDVTIVFVALPTIQQELGGSFSDVQWVIDAYALTLAALLLTDGALADRYGRRLVFAVGLVIFTGGSALCGFAQSPLMLIISRALQGSGGAALFATSIALLGNSFRGPERGVAFGVWGAVTGIATSLGPVLGGVITSAISWRGIFIVNVPVGVVALAITFWRVEESKTPDAHSPDWPGFATLTAGLIALVYGLTRAGEMSWGDTGSLICFALAVVLLVSFVLVERSVAHPMFDLSLFRVPTFVGGAVAAFCMNGSMFAAFVYLVLYLQNDLGLSALQAGLRIMVLTGTSLFVSIAAGRASQTVPTRLLIGPGLVCVGVGLLLMAGLTGMSTWTHLIPGLIVGGIGVGLVNPPLASTAVGVVEPARMGMASGGNSTFRQIGLATMIAALGSIFSSRLTADLHSRLSDIPAAADRSADIAAAIKGGATAKVLDATPPAARAPLETAIHAAFASSLNYLLIVTGILALVGAVGSFALIRQKDFVLAPVDGPPAGEGAGAAAAAA